MNNNIENLIDEDLFDYEDIYEIIYKIIREDDSYSEYEMLREIFEDGSLMDSITCFEDLYYELSKHLDSDDFQNLMEEACHYYIEIKLDNNNFSLNGGNPYIINDRGLIYIEREIAIPELFSRFKYDDYENYYDYLKNYDGLGIYWSYIKGGANAYCSDNFKDGTSHIVLRGYVDPSNINWENTIYKTIYNLNFELEIEVNEESPIEIFEIVVSRMENNGKTFVGKKLPLNYSIIFKA